LKLKVVIEGVESREQIDFISSMIEVPHIQGYYFSPPLREGPFADWLIGRELVKNA
jgi:diguanylate cyclase